MQRERIRVVKKQYMTKLSKAIALNSLFIMILILMAGCDHTGKEIEQSYGKYKYEDSDGQTEIIEINQDEIKFDNVDVNALKGIKATFEAQKEINKLEKEGMVVDDNKKKDLKEKYFEEIDWSSFYNQSFSYNAEYEEESQAVYFESVTENDNEIYFSYDLKHKTLTVYNIEFTKD